MLQKAKSEIFSASRDAEEKYQSAVQDNNKASLLAQHEIEQRDKQIQQDQQTKDQQASYIQDLLKQVVSPTSPLRLLNDGCCIH